MPKKQTAYQYLSQKEGTIPTTPKNKTGNSWEEYSFLHDNFSELLSYENGIRIGSEFWHLNYI